MQNKIEVANSLFPAVIAVQDRAPNTNKEETKTMKTRLKNNNKKTKKKKKKKKKKHAAQH